MVKKKVTLIMSLLLLTVLTLAGQNYSEALLKAVQFFDANKCGPDAAADNVFSWRGACHTQDGADVGVNLTGGFHDAGDHVKFGLPQGYAASVLGWGLYEFREQFDQTGVTPKLLSTLKYFTDYFIASKVGDRFYYQIGEGEVDHTYWGPPEDQTEDRPSYAWADASHPASDVLSQTSAALTLMYLNYRSTNNTYASQCLSLARELYDMARTNIGKGDGQSFYQSSSLYDDLAWAATWLYVVDGDSFYITAINDYLQNPNIYGDYPLQKNHWTMCWDDMGLAVLAKMAILTGDSIYVNVLEENLNYWMTSLETTPGGLKYLSNWGVLRYASAESFIALLYYGHTGNTAYFDMAKSQLDYALGDNPANLSYVIGYGASYPSHPHHRAANGYTYANGDNQKPAKNLLTGALVGGPDQSDRYIDDVNQYQYTEVAIDYNAGFVSALAGLIKYNGGPIPTPTPVPLITPTPAAGLKGDVNGDRAVNIIDALLVARAVVELDSLDSAARERGDADCNGSLNILDALIIAQYSVGLVDSFCS